MTAPKKVQNLKRTTSTEKTPAEQAANKKRLLKLRAQAEAEGRIKPAPVKKPARTKEELLALKARAGVEGKIKPVSPGRQAALDRMKKGTAPEETI